MIIADIEQLPKFTAADGTRLCELLHPLRRADLPLQCNIAFAEVAAGAHTRRHRLRTSHEVYCFIRGRGRMTVGNETSDVATGQAVFIPAGEWQSVENVGAEPLQFFCIAEPAWRADDEEVEAAETTPVGQRR